MAFVRCPGCHSEIDFDDYLFEVENQRGQCADCKSEFGLHSLSTYFRCKCGKGCFSYSATELTNGVCDRCEVCGCLFSIIPPRTEIVYYACPKKCGQIFSVDRGVLNQVSKGEFDCDCGAIVVPRTGASSSSEEVSCRSCGKAWSIAPEHWQFELSCGHVVSVSEITSSLFPNFYDYKTPALSKISPTTRQSPPPNLRSASGSGSRFDKWRKDAFVAGDILGMGANFIFQSLSYGFDALKEKKSNRDSEIDISLTREKAKVSIYSGEAQSNANYVDLRTLLGSPTDEELKSAVVTEITEAICISIAEELVNESAMKQAFRRLAASPPVCSIEDEATYWLRARGLQLTKREINAAIFSFFSICPIPILLHGDEALIDYCRTVTNYYRAR